MVSDLIQFFTLGIRLSIRMVSWCFWAIVFGAILLFLRAPSARADDWICKSQAGERRGQAFLACGVADAKTEAEARAQSLEHAQAEFATLCRASDDCVNRSIRVHPERTDCESIQGGIRCYRAVLYTVENAPGGQLLASRADRQPPKLPISTGMTKAELLERMGTPTTVLKHDPGYQSFGYLGEMCVYGHTLCWVELQDGLVSDTTDVKPEFTDLLK